MSKHGTMTSNISDILPQQQRNLQHLQSLQQHTRSLTMNSNDHAQLRQQQEIGRAASLNENHGVPDVQFEQGKNSLTNMSEYSKPRNSKQFQRSNQQLDPRSPLVFMIPTSAQPTSVLASRFAAWRSIIKSIVAYLTETASIQDEVVRQQLRLIHAIQFPFFSVENQYQPSTTEDKTTQNFFLPLGNGSIQDLPTILNQYHGTLVSSASRISKELTTDIVPRLEDLRRDLLVKIKEIKFLHSDFKNSCNKELQQTKQDMKRFLESINDAKMGVAKQDPYLAKIILDTQIKKQISEENFLHEAFNNLETSGAELEKVVVMEIQNALTVYARLLGQQSQLVFDILISKLDSGFFNKDPQFEWDNFIARDPNFIPPNQPQRKVQSLVYKNQNDPFTYEVRSDFLEKRSKFLKSYSKGYYVLTPNFLHEFKTADRKRDLVPTMSLPLIECSITEHSKKGSSDYKFILHAKQDGLIRRGHNWVFRTNTYESMLAWYNDLKALTSVSSSKERAKFVLDKLGLEVNGKSNKEPSSNNNNDNNNDNNINNNNIKTNTNPPVVVTTAPENSNDYDENHGRLSPITDNTSYDKPMSLPAISLPDSNMENNMGQGVKVQNVPETNLDSTLMSIH